MYVIELNRRTSRMLLLIFCISQGNVVTHLRCGGKNDKRLVANLLLSERIFFFNRPTFLKVMNEHQVARFDDPRCMM